MSLIHGTSPTLFEAVGGALASEVSATHDHDSPATATGRRAQPSRRSPRRRRRRTLAVATGSWRSRARRHGHGHEGSPQRALSFALGITSVFMVVEVVVGVWSGSLALLADAGHMLADAGALVLAIVAQHFAEKPRTDRTTFGLSAPEVLAAFVNGIALAFVGLLIVKEAIERWIAPIAIQGRPCSRPQWAASSSTCWSRSCSCAGSRTSTFAPRSRTY